MRLQYIDLNQISDIQIGVNCEEFEIWAENLQLFTFLFILYFITM